MPSPGRERGYLTGEGVRRERPSGSEGTGLNPTFLFTGLVALGD